MGTDSGGGPGCRGADCAVGRRSRRGGCVREENGAAAAAERGSKTRRRGNGTCKTKETKMLTKKEIINGRRRPTDYSQEKSRTKE